MIDACGIATKTLSQSDFSCADLGLTGTATILVTMTVTDVNGNSNTCKTDVNLFDVTTPDMSCNTSISVQLDGTGAYDLTTTEVDNGSTDECNLALSLDWINGDPTNAISFDCNDLAGSPYSITLTGTDGANMASCVATVSVTDMMAPFAVTFADINQTADAGECGAEISGTSLNFPFGLPNDNCTANPSVNWTISGATTDAGTDNIVQLPSTTYFFNTGVSFVDYTAQDDAGNIESYSFFVTITDDEDPVLACAPGFSVTISDTDCEATVPDVVSAFTTATDNCGVTITQNPMAGSTVGVTHNMPFTITVTGVDAAGNMAACEYSITPLDVTYPSITCTDDIVVNNDEGICGEIVVYNLPITADNCPGDDCFQANALNADWGTIVTNGGDGSVVVGPSGFNVTLTGSNNGGSSESILFYNVLIFK